MQDFYQQCWGTFEAKMMPQLPESILALGRRFGRKMAQVLEQLQDPPQTLIHNDYMLDNLFFATTGNEVTLTVVDWQLLAYGRAMGDVSSFLGGNVAIEDRRAHEWELLRTYHAMLVDNGVR